MKIKSNMEQAEIFVFIASFFLIIIGFNGSQKNNQQDNLTKEIYKRQQLEKEIIRVKNEN